MRYLSIFSSKETGAPPTPEEIATMEKLIAEEQEAGVLVTTEGCLPSDRGFKVRRAGKNTTVTDGPFSEAKEVVGGFAILQVNSKEEAIAAATRFLDVVGDGECEIRELYEVPALAAEG
jgi:hypothetical protein